MVGRVSANDDHVARDSGRPNRLRVVEELDLVNCTAVGVRYDNGLILGKVGAGVAPPFRISSNVG